MTQTQTQTQTQTTTKNITATATNPQMPNFKDLKKDELIKECEKLFTLNIRNITILRELLDIKIEHEENLEKSDARCFILTNYFQMKMLEEKFIKHKNLIELNKIEAVLLLQIQYMFSKNDASKAFRANQLRWNNTRKKYILYFDVFTSCMKNGQIENYNRQNPALNIPLNPKNTDEELQNEYESFI